MKYFYSKTKPNILLHAVVNLENVISENFTEHGNIKRVEIAPPEQFLQTSLLKFNKGPVTKAHKHLWKTPPEKTITQESMVVIKGRIKFIMYDLDDEILDEVNVESGGLTLTFQGGHTYEALEDDTIVYEYKTGPYYGQETDKKWI